MIPGVTKTSADWTGIKLWIAKRIAALATELEGPLSIDSTSYVRGQIAELRNLLSEGEPVEIPRVEPINYEA